MNLLDWREYATKAAQIQTVACDCLDERVAKHFPARKKLKEKEGIIITAGSLVSE